LKDAVKNARVASPSAAQAAAWEGYKPLPKRQVVLTMAGVMLAIFLAALDQTIVGTAMPRIIADLGEFDKFTWVTTAYLVTSTAVVPIVGKLTDMYGRKAFFVGGIVIFLTGSVLSGLSQSMNQLIAFRALQGIGGGVLFANAFISIGDLFPPAERGKYMGFISATFGVSSIVGPVLGGVITDSLSWHWVFFINVPIAVPIILLFIRFFPNIRPEQRKHRIDYLGIILLLIAVTCLILGLSWGGGPYAWSSPQVLTMLVVAGVATMAFVAVELRAPEPIMPLTIYRNPIVAIAMMAVFFAGFGMFAGAMFVPLYFQGVLGESAAGTGGILTPMMLGTVVGAASSGQAMARLGGRYRIIGLVGLALMAFGIYLTSQMGPDTSHGRSIANIVLMGFGLGMTLPTYALAVQNAVPYSMLGAATSAVQFIRSIAATIGLAVLGSVMATRFASGIADNLSPDARSAVPPDLLAELGNNPRALVDPEAMATLQTTLGGGDGGLTQQVVGGLRASLASALTDVFLVALGVVAVAFLATIFLKEIPLKRGPSRAGRPDTAPTGSQQPQCTPDVAGQSGH
jgi:EmrB/QacA subfamily drug resistance transporter